MAYDSANLTQMCHGGGVKWWNYSTTDNIATVNTSGYFNSAVGMLSLRDVIIVQDTATPTTSLVSVVTNTGTVVDVTDGLAITETNTD